MRHLGAVLAAGALLVLAAGCAQQVDTGAGPAITTGTTTAPAGPAMPGLHLPAGAEPVPGSQVDAAALPRGYPREVWTERGGTVLGLDVEQGGCVKSTAVLAQQTAAQVTVRLMQGTTGAQAQACPMYLAYQPVTVTLAAPLGKRTVVLVLERG